MRYQHHEIYCVLGELKNATQSDHQMQLDWFGLNMFFSLVASSSLLHVVKMSWKSLILSWCNQIFNNKKLIDLHKPMQIYWFCKKKKRCTQVHHRENKFIIKFMQNVSVVSYRFFCLVGSVIQKSCSLSCLRTLDIISLTYHPKLSIYPTSADKEMLSLA